MKDQLGILITGGILAIGIIRLGIIKRIKRIDWRRK